MRITFGALFIAIGISILWLAATGNLDRFASAWDVITGKSEGAGAAPAAGGVQPTSFVPSLVSSPGELTLALPTPTLPVV
jgi:hypothetical protein